MITSRARQPHCMMFIIASHILNSQVPEPITSLMKFNLESSEVEMKSTAYLN